MRHSFIFISFAFFLSFTTGTNAQEIHPGRSVLSSGKFYKLKINQSGIFKITKATTDKLGITQQIDLRKVKVYSNIGGHLPESLAQTETSDLIDLPLMVRDNANNVLDAGDEILFYAEGPNKWNYNPAGKQWDYNLNIYDRANYVFLTIDGAARSNIEDLKIDSGGAEYSANSYDQLQIYNEDMTNVLTREVNTQGSGRQWFGDYFRDREEKNFLSKFDISAFKSDEPIFVKGIFGSRSPQKGSVKLDLGSVNASYNLTDRRLDDFESSYLSIANFNTIVENASDLQAIKVTYSGNSGSAEGWLDYIQLTGKSTLVYKDKSFVFSDAGSLNKTSAFTFSGSTTDLFVWDVSQLAQIKNLPIEAGKFTAPQKSVLGRYLVFKLKDAIEPEPIGLIKNQNLHSITKADMLVVCADELYESAVKLADHRKQLDKLDVVVVPISEVYNEFSSGRQDVTALRDFVKMVYDRDQVLKYLLLFGDATFDYRKITEPNNTFDYVPVYETQESIHPVFAFPTDDYFALLSDGEGGNLVGALDISVGRLPVKSKNEADAVVNKIIRYDTDPERFGDWRLSVGFAADDEDSNTHIVQADRIARKVASLYPQMNIRKTYFDSYQQVTTPGGERFPDATDDISNQVFKGLLAICYLGHGGPSGISQERVLQINDIKNWKNREKPVLFITATCSLTGFDNPDFVTTGEEAILMPYGGAIALFSTVRSVYSSENERLTSSVFDFIFQKTNGAPQRLGDIIMKAKNNQGRDTVSANARKFALIGDPSQKIGLPEHKISVTRINNTEAAIFEDTLSALESVKIEGEIIGPNGMLLKDFNGSIYISVYDKPSDRQTLANDPRSFKYTFSEFKNIIFKGVATVKNGKFSSEFTMPRDINYTIGLGKISMYASDGNSDAGGNFEGPYIGGDSEVSVEDKLAPEIELFINNRAFRDGGITHANPILIVDLSDDFGINITGNSIGHDLTATMTGPLKKTFILNDFYEADQNSPNKGRILFPINDLPPGDYEIRVKAWDIANNSAVESITFTVLENQLSEILNVYNYPNPFIDNTIIAFEHDRVSQNALVELFVYNTSGALVISKKIQKPLTGSIDTITEGEGGGSPLSNLHPGIYFYKINITDESFGLRLQSKFHKLVKL